jgi:hypothetical protein
MEEKLIINEVNDSKEINRNIKSVKIDGKCKSFDKKKLMCSHLVHITYNNNTNHKIILTAEDITKNYNEYIKDNLRTHLFFMYDRLLFDEEYFIYLDEKNINKYANSCCVIS